MLFRSFTWLQNREAVEILVEKIWPTIKSQIPECKLWIIGKDAKEFFKKLEAENIKVSEIDDVRKAYQSAWVLVAPIYGGGGTRYKNLESFASGLPVVTTSIGIRGINVKDGQDLIIRDDPSSIADAAVKLIRDSGVYKKIADNAKRVAKQKYDWDPIAKKLSNIYEDLGGKSV